MRVPQLFAIFILVAFMPSLGFAQQGMDAAAAFSEAVNAAPLPTDQSVIDTFASQETPPENLFGGPGNATNLGLAPQFNQTGPGALSRLRYTGMGTVAYSQTPIASSGAVNLGCGFGYVEPSFQAAFVGAGASFFQRGFGCGRCIKLQCDDVTCDQPGRQLVAQIVDQCGECFDADLNLAYPLMVNLSGKPPTTAPSLAVSWEFVDCSPYINSSIKMLVKPGGTAYFQSFNFANSRQVITAVQVNGQLLRHETNNYWSWSPTGGPINPRGPFDFALLGANRQVLRVRLPQLRSADLGIQFSAPTGVPAGEPAPAEAAAAGGAPAPPPVAAAAP